MLARSMKRTVSIVGAGRVGKTLGKRLRERGWRIRAVVTRSAASARAAVRAIGAGTPFAAEKISPRQGGSAGLQPREKRPVLEGALAPGLAGLFRGSELELRRKHAHLHGALAPEVHALLQSDLILFATPDDALPSIAEALATIAGSAWRGKIALHTSATLDRSTLAPLARRGASVGSLHPMQAFGGAIVPNLRGVIFAIEGDPKARRIAHSIAKSLGGIPVAIATRDKPVYHAAAVMAGGSLYPVFEAGLRLLTGIGFTRPSAEQTLLPLARQILDNIGRIGPRAAWTGPLSRGDYAIVAKHARALRRFAREIQESYAALALLAGRLLAKNPRAAMKQIHRALAAR